jgi:hypothetical protein
VGRFASAFAFLVMLAVVLGSAGCGQRFDNAAGAPPTEAELASQALAALEEAGSAHVVVDANGGSVSGTNVPLGLHFEGDVSASAIAGDGEVRFGDATLGARLLVGEHNVYIRFMGAWYQADSGLEDARAKANEKGAELLAELQTPEGLGKHFADLFEGDVKQGSDLDGVSTWEFDGHLSAETLARYIELYGDTRLTDNDRAMLDKVAETSHVVLVVGKEDHLPRKIELSLDPPKDLHFDSEDLASSDGPFSVKIELSDFGEDVSFSAPKDARPLDELFQQIFGVMG